MFNYLNLKTENNNNDSTEASFVDEKMREVQQGLSDPESPTRIAMLAAMNIADEYFTMRNDKDKFSSEIEGKVQSIIEVIDEELN